MNKNYITYPCKVMRITQNYNGKTSHAPHTTGNPKDYPFDEACSDTGKEGFYCPCDEVVVVKKYGVGNSGTNTLWIQSTTTAYAANGRSGTFSALITHPDDSDLKKIKIGQKFKRNELICKEGKDGATANHLHISAGLGIITGTGWTKNSKGKWVLTVLGNTYKPEDLFYIDPDFTTKIISKGGLNFKLLPEEPKYQPGKYKVTKANVLRIRPSASTKGDYKKFEELSASAKKKIKALNNGKPADGYVRGLEFTVIKTEDNWGYNNSGWMCLDYCDKTD